MPPELIEVRKWVDEQLHSDWTVSGMDGKANVWVLETRVVMDCDKSEGEKIWRNARTLNIIKEINAKVTAGMGIELAVWNYVREGKKWVRNSPSAVRGLQWVTAVSNAGSHFHPQTPQQSNSGHKQWHVVVVRTPAPIPFVIIRSASSSPVGHEE